MDALLGTAATVRHNRLQCSAFAYKLSSRDLVEMMSERGIALHTRQFCAGYESTYRFLKSNGSLRATGGRIMVLRQTYIKVKGRWTYLYRAVDKEVSRS
jgi:transposase-like protein